MGCLCKKRNTNQNLLIKIKEDFDIENQNENLDKKREFALFLIENSNNFHKKHYNEVKQLKDEQFINLYKGNTDYKEFGSHDPKGFLDLVQKFQDNQELLSQWCGQKKYYEIVKVLWKMNIIPKCKGKEDAEQESILKDHRIDTSNWDTNFYQDFKSMVNVSAEDIIAKRMKCYIEADYGTIDEFVKLEEKCRQQVEENEKSSCGKSLIDNLETSMYSKLKLIFPIFYNKYSTDFDNMSKDIAERQKKVALEKMIKAGMTEKKSQKILEKVMKEYKEKKYTKNFTFDSKKELENVKDFTIKFSKGEIDELKFKDKAEIFFSNKMIKHATLGLSLVNLGYSVLNLSKKFLDSNNLKAQVRIRLDSIKDSFKIHQNKVNDIPVDIDEAIIYIKKLYKDFNDDLEAVNQLMEDIKLAINNEENERNKAIIQTFLSGVGVGFSIFGISLTKGSDRIEYAASSVSNILTVGVSAANIAMSVENIKNFQKNLEEVQTLGKQIEEEIEKLKQKFSTYGRAHWA